MSTRAFMQEAGGIDWYCEIRGAGPVVTLVPSGEGDCASFARTADLLAERFTVVTFDMPGFSRSSTPAEFGHVAPQVLGEQIASLMKALGIQRATYYGCSSGGQAVLSLVADHSDSVRNAIVHEVALGRDDIWPDLAAQWRARLESADDASVVRLCEEMFRTQLNDDPRAWDSLGAEFHSRLKKNYVTWVRHYVGPHAASDRAYSVSDLTKRPVAWTVGGFSLVWRAIGNILTAQRAGIAVEFLRCRHFPQVSIPEELARHIRSHTEKYLDNVAS